jgi:hypothetical protein
LWAASVHGYGPRGHQYVGAIADELLTANARNHVSQLLGMPLREAATWADCVKDVVNAGGRFRYKPDSRFHESCSVFETPQGIAQMEDYVRRNTNNCERLPSADVCHKQYHFTDVAFQRGRYNRSYVGTSDHDIVAALNAAIAVLRDKSAPHPFKIKDKREALYVLAHFVGDVHQPLHVGAIYLDRRGIPVDPDAGARSGSFVKTRGGNWLDVGKKNLHSDWDAISRSLNPLHPTRPALSRARSEKAATGTIEGWPAQWASETVVVSRVAFSGLSFTGPSNKKGHWVVHFDDRKGYLKLKNKLQAEELEKAGARLAQILNSIWP